MSKKVHKTIAALWRVSGRVVCAVEDVEENSGTENFIVRHFEMESERPRGPGLSTESSMVWLKAMYERCKNWAFNVVFKAITMWVTTSKPARAGDILESPGGAPAPAKRFELRGKDEGQFKLGN